MGFLTILKAINEPKQVEDWYDDDINTSIHELSTCIFDPDILLKINFNGSDHQRTMTVLYYREEISYLSAKPEDKPQLGVQVEEPLRLLDIYIEEFTKEN